MHFPGKSEIEVHLHREYGASPAQVGTVVASAYTFRVIAAAVPIGLLVAHVSALKQLAPAFFGSLLVMLVVLVAWQIISGWIGTWQAVEGRGDMVMATFLVTFIGLSWAFPRRGTKPPEQVDQPDR